MSSKNNFSVIMIDSLVGNAYSESLCNGLFQCNVDVSLVVPSNKKITYVEKYKIYTWGPSKDPTVSLLIKMTNLIKYYIKLTIHLFKHRRRIVVHYQFFKNQYECFYYLFLKLFQFKLVHTAHNVLPHDSANRARFFFNLIYKSSDILIAHSNYIKTRLIELFHVPPDKIHIIPHGNFDIYLPPHPICKADARKKLNLCETDKILLFFGYIREYKGVDHLLNTFSRIDTNKYHLKLIIAGLPATQELYTKLKKMIDRINSDSIIFIPKFIEKHMIPTYFSACDLVVLPYKNINHSGIIHLAYSFGKTVIATDVGDLKETVIHDKTGFIVKKNDIEDFKEAIIYAITHDKKLGKMGKDAKVLSDTKYSWQKIGFALKNLYDQLF
jgi:D-inositol-3-phosphate glycosyltransferase